MVRKFLATAAVLALVTGASATITASLDGPYPVALTAGAADYYDIWVHVTDGPDGLGADDWTAAGIDAVVDTSFYQDLFDANPPNPLLFPSFPDSEFTSFYSSPGDWPNAPFNGAIVGIAATADGGNVLDTDWFDTIDSGNGDFVIARVTVMQRSDGLYDGVIDLDVAARNTGGELFHFQWIITPEPASLALLALGGLALIRRR